MPLTTLTGEDDIITRIKTIDGVDVFNGEYAPDSYVPVVDSNKLFKPYILVKFNGGFPAHDDGIVGSKYDTQRATITIYVVSPDDRVTRQIRDQIRELLITNDWQPTDGSCLWPISALSFIDAGLGYHRYVHVISFSYYFNLS